MLADIIYANEHGKNSWDVLKWDVLKSVGRKYEKGKLVKYKSACLCTIEHPINELVQYVLSLTDGKNSWDVGRKYEKGKLVKYKSACLCTLEHPINELVHVHELRAMISNSTLH